MKTVTMTESLLLFFNLFIHYPELFLFNLYEKKENQHKVRVFKLLVMTTYRLRFF